MGPIKIGVISYDHLHAPRYAAVIAAHPQAQLAAIADEGVNASVAQAEAQQYGASYFNNYETMLAQANLDGIYVGTMPTRHRDVVAQAAEQGIHVLCDKPIATTLADADAIVATARQAGIKLMVPFNPRFQLPLMKVKEALDSGEAGELVAIYAVKYGRLPSKATGPQKTDWFMEAAQAGGGGFLDIGIHAIDALRWLADAPARAVHAHIGTHIHPGLACDDLGTMTVTFANGVVAALSAGWANPDSTPTWLDVRFEILTTKQAFIINSPYHDFALFTNQKAERRYWWRRDIDGLVNDFVQAIIQNREPAITGEDGRAALALVLAAYESSRTGDVIRLN